MRKKRVFGTGKVTKPENAGSSAPGKSQTRWSQSIKSSAELHQGIKNINAKMLPVTQIKIDENNPRELWWTPELLLQLLDQKTLSKEQLRDEDSIKHYIATLPHDFKDQPQQTKIESELTALFQFAGALGSAQGIINPITATVDGMTATIIAGERRFLACLILGETHAPVRLIDDPLTEFDRVLMQWSENEDRENLSLHEQLVNLRRITEAWQTKSDQGSLTVRAFAAQTGMSKSYAQLYLKVIRSAKQDLLDRIAAGEISSIKDAADLVGNTSPPPKKTTRRPGGSLRVSRDTDITAARFIVDATLEKFDDPQLSHDIAQLDLKEIKGINQALKLILGALSNER